MSTVKLLKSAAPSKHAIVIEEEVFRGPIAIFSCGSLDVIFGGKKVCKYY